MALSKLHCRSFTGLRNLLPLCSSPSSIKARKESSIPASFYRRHSFDSFSRHLVSRWMDEINGNHGLSPSFSKGYTCQFSRSMATFKTKLDRKKRDLARREFQLLRRKTKLMKAAMSPEERLLWRLKRANRKRAILLQRLKKYELEEDPEPVHDPELITPEQLHALKKIGYKNRNYVPVGRRGVYGGVVQNMHMHWKFHETVQVDCHIFKREDMRTVAKQLAVLSGGIVIDIHQKTTIIMYRGRNYKQPKTEMIPKNTLTKRKALFKSKFLQALDMIDENIKNIEGELQNLRRKQKQNVSNETEVNKVQQLSRSEYAEISSDDDGGFSWESDSLDEDELSEAERIDSKNGTNNDSEVENKVKPISWTLEPAMRSPKKRPQASKELVKAEQQLFIHGSKKSEERARERHVAELKSGTSYDCNGSSDNACGMATAHTANDNVHDTYSNNNNPVGQTHAQGRNERSAEFLAEFDRDENAGNDDEADEFGTDFDDLCDVSDSEGLNDK